MNIDNLNEGMKVRVLSKENTRRAFGWNGDMEKYLNTIQTISGKELSHKKNWALYLKMEKIGYGMLMILSLQKQNH